LGTLIVLSAYALTVRGGNPTGIVISSLNILGSILLLTTALLLLNVGFVLLNAAWITIAILGYIRSIQERSQSKSEDDYIPFSPRNGGPNL
jgi:hypothetical protein